MRGKGSSRRRTVYRTVAIGIGIVWPADTAAVRRASCISPIQQRCRKRYWDSTGG